VPPFFVFVFGDALISISFLFSLSQQPFHPVIIVPTPSSVSSSINKECFWRPSTM
jgi:hypothetical protein